MLFILTVRRLWLEPPSDLWGENGWIPWVPWFGFVLLIHSATSTFALPLMMRIWDGWPYRILRFKFSGVFDAANKKYQTMQNKAYTLLKENQDEISHEATHLAKALQIALKPVFICGRGIQGPFRGPRRLTSLALVFGQPFSWKWVLPLFPGGHGDALEPSVYDGQLCNDWIAIGTVMDQCDNFLEEQTKISIAWQVCVDKALEQVSKRVSHDM